MSGLRLEHGPFPDLQALRIDFSNAVVNESAREARLRPTDRRLSGKAVHAASFELVGRPVKSGRGPQVNMEVRARDVRLDFGRDKDNQPLLLMTEAQDGQSGNT